MHSEMNGNFFARKAEFLLFWNIFVLRIIFVRFFFHLFCALQDSDDDVKHVEPALSKGVTRSGRNYTFFSEIQRHEQHRP